MLNGKIILKRLLSKFIFLTLILLGVSSCKISNIENEILRKTIEWNTLNNTLDDESFTKLFASRVVGYGKSLTAREFIEAKLKYLKKFSGFTQAITSDLTLTLYDGSIVRCDFTKRASFDGKVKNYPAYLIFEKVNGEYLITEEGDEVTNSNIGYKPNLPAAKKTLLIPFNNIKAGINWTIALVIGGVIILSLLLILVVYKMLFKPKLNIEKNTNGITTSSHVENGTTTTIAFDDKEPSTLEKMAPTSLDSQNSADSKDKGDAFEKYIVRCFDEKYFKVKDWTGDKGIDGRYAESNKNPDLIFHFRALTSEGTFAVECKFRQKIDTEGYVELCYSDQLSRYKEFARKSRMPVFIALGVGGTPDYPEDIFMLPIDKVKHHKMEFYEINRFKKYSGRSFFYNANAGTLQ